MMNDNELERQKRESERKDEIIWLTTTVFGIIVVGIILKVVWWFITR